MRVSFLLFAWLIVSITCHAQNSVGFKSYENSQMVGRWNDKVQTAMNANNDYYSGKKRKPDKSLQTEFSGKSFTGGGGDFDKKLSGQNKFLFDQKVTPQGFATRSFLGIRNPWFGKKTVESEKASLWSKTDVANAGKKFAVEDADTRGFYQADKKAGERLEIVPTRSTKMEAKYQGFLDKTMSKKDLTVEEVRTLLNKSR